MREAVDDRTILDKFAENFAEVVEKHCRYIIVSGFVSIAHGRSRSTEDIDMILERISKEKFISLHNDLIKAGFICIQSDNPEIIYDDYLKENNSIRYTNNKEFFPPEMEIKLAKDSIDEMQLKERKKFPITGLDVWFSSIESNIAFKEELLKSQKDIEDAKHLRIIYKNEISEDKIREIKEQIKRIRMDGKDGI